MTEPTLPNILVIMADDHAQWAAHCYGNSELRTPNMDFLAESGLLMQNAYTPCPVCSPARACFFTGRLPSQHGIHDFLASTEEFNHGWMNGETTLPMLLKENGYQTGLIGKWHCTTSSTAPQPGFDRWVSYGYNEKAGWRNQYLHQGPTLISEQGEDKLIHGYQTRYFNRQAVRFLRERDTKQPFFLFVGPTDTHFPFVGHPSRLAEHYRQARFWDIPENEKSHLEPSSHISSYKGTAEEALAQYYSAVGMLDDQIGVLLDELNGSGDLDNTLVVYTSDHGHMNGHHGHYGKGNATMPQNFYEESIRVPCLMRWPKKLPAKRQPSMPFDHCDLFQTILDAAQVKLSSEQKKKINSPGQSLLPHIEGISSDWRAYQFCEYGNARMISNSKLKLVRRYAPHSDFYTDEFFDLSIDPREAVNRIGDPLWQDKITGMGNRLEKHFQRYEDPQRSAKNIQTQPPCNSSELWRS